MKYDDEPMHEVCFRYLYRNLRTAQARDAKGVFTDRETLDQVRHAFKIYLNCPRPPGWTPVFPTDDQD